QLGRVIAGRIARLFADDLAVAGDGAAARACGGIQREDQHAEIIVGRSGSFGGHLHDFAAVGPRRTLMASTVTPAMRQYLEAKRQHRDAIVFFRMGDFYEMFYEDALVAARALDLTLTSRSKDAGGNGIPMCGVPYHAVDSYLGKLVRKGHRV